jgi:subtilase family serine protease
MADPENTIEESNEDNNCLSNHIRLTGMGTPDQAVQVLGVISESKKKR